MCRSRSAFTAWYKIESAAATSGRFTPRCSSGSASKQLAAAPVCGLPLFGAFSNAGVLADPFDVGIDGLRQHRNLMIEAAGHAHVDEIELGELGRNRGNLGLAVEHRKDALMSPGR